MLIISSVSLTEAGSGYVYKNTISEEFYFVCDGIDDYIIALNQASAAFETNVCGVVFYTVGLSDLSDDDFSFDDEYTITIDMIGKVSHTL